MNPNAETERTKIPPVSPSKRQVLQLQTAAMVAIVIIAILASAASAYSTTLPASLVPANQGNTSIVQVNATASPTASVSMTVSVSSTQVQMATTQTNVSMTSQSMSTQSSSQTMTTIQASNSVTTQTMSTTSVAAQQCGYGCFHRYNPQPPYYPGYPGYYPSYPAYPSYVYGYGACGYGVTYSGNVQCTGYVYQAPNGCVELVIQIVNPYSYTSTLQYYTLHNLPSTPPTGTLVTVSGQMYQGYNTSTSGAACPGNYINVSSITAL